MDPVTAALLGEGIKLLAQGLLTQMKVAGKSPEEMDVIWQAEKTEFFENHPDLMPDV